MVGMGLLMKQQQFKTKEVLKIRHLNLLEGYPRCNIVNMSESNLHKIK